MDYKLELEKAIQQQRRTEQQLKEVTELAERMRPVVEARNKKLDIFDELAAALDDALKIIDNTIAVDPNTGDHTYTNYNTLKATLEKAKAL